MTGYNFVSNVHLSTINYRVIPFMKMKINYPYYLFTFRYKNSRNHDLVNTVVMPRGCLCGRSKKVKNQAMVLSMDRWVGKVAVVTGASSGIGAAIAEKLVGEGIKVVGLARRKEKMDELAKKLSGKKGKLYPLKADVSKEEDILNAFKWIKDNLGPIHILVNNAGIARPGSLTESNTENWDQNFKVNVFGLLIATREAVKDMKANHIDGHIIHINSILGHQLINLPGLNAYPATKFAVRALAETLRLELNAAKSKIKITNLSPGAVYTEMATGPAPEDLKKMLEKMVEEKTILDAEDIADGVGYVLSTPPHVQIQELTIRGVIEPF